MVGHDTEFKQQNFCKVLDRLNACEGKPSPAQKCGLLAFRHGHPQCVTLSDRDGGGNTREYKSSSVDNLKSNSGQGHRHTDK